MKYYLAQSTATDGTYVRWTTSRPTSPALDYIHTTNMPSATQLGNIRITLFSDSAKLSEGKTHIWIEETTPSGVVNIYPKVIGVAEDEFFASTSPTTNVLNIQVKDTSLYTKFVVAPSSTAVFKGVI